MKSLSPKLPARLSLTFLAGTLLLTGSTLAFIRLADAKESPKPALPRLVVDDKPIQRDGKSITSFSPVVKKVAPSVVNVFITTKAKNVSAPRGPLPEGDFFRRFFGDEFGGGDMDRRFRIPKQRGLGSGVIVSKDGYLLTNNHVVDNADEVKVVLNSDRREYTAKVVGKDPKTDIAVLKIDASDLPFVELADSDQVEIGDLVLAIGNPFGVGQTVTMGMVSATGRANMGLDYEDFIQTDAAINPGNSGGALVDAEGRLIGINTAILSRSGGNQGIGFAVPINLARSVMEGLITDGRVVRGFLGVNIQDVNTTLAREFKLKDAAGSLVAEVTPNSAAEKAGLKSGDVILEFNGKPVRDSRHLKLQVAETPPGEKVPVKVWRDGAQKTIEVTLKEMPQTELSARAGGDAKESSEKLSGVTVGDVDSSTRSQLKLPGNVKGAVVTSVDEDSPAFEAGLREGDVILEINRKPVQNAEDAVTLSEKIKDDTILLRIWSRGGTRYLVVDESKAG